MYIQEIFSTALSEIILRWMIVVFSLALLVIFSYTVYYRIRNYRIEVAMHRLRPVFKELVSTVHQESMDEQGISQAIRKQDFRYFERYLRGAISIIGECDVQAELKIANLTGFSEFMRKKVRSKKGWKQALSLRTLSYFRSKDNKALFEQVIQKSTFAPSILAAGLGLALCDSYETMEQVFEKVYDTTNCNVDVLLMITSAYGPESAPFLHQLIINKSASVNELCIMVDAIGIYYYKPAVNTLLELLESTTSLELKLHIVDALKFIGNFNVADKLVPYLKHENYFMRVKAALSISALGGKDYIILIEPLLHDRKWWVRRNAAEAILNTGFDGLQRLKEIAKSAEDFPRAAAQMILIDIRFNKLGLITSE